MSPLLLISCRTAHYKEAVEISFCGLDRISAYRRLLKHILPLSLLPSFLPSFLATYEMFRMGTTSTPGANGNGDDSTESFLLEFGTNTTVCDEQRRAYMEEISQIEEDTGRLRESIKRETNCQTQLEQDVKHTHTECSDISRGTADQLSSAKVYSGTVAEALESVKNEFVKPTTHSNDEDESELARDQSPAQEGESQKLWKVIKAFTESTKSVRTLVNEESRSAKTIKADAEKATTEIRNTRDKVSSEKLKEKLKQIDQVISLEKKKEEDESNRMVALETSVQLSRANKETHSERLNAAVSEHSTDISKVRHNMIFLTRFPSPIR